MKIACTAVIVLFASIATAAEKTTLTWIPGSSKKVEQLIGDCDYEQQARTGQCIATTSRTATRAQLLGTDIGASFESQGKLIFLFGDSIGPGVDYGAADTMASSVSTDPEGGVFLDVLTKTDGTPYFARIQGVRMGAAEVPHGGIRLDGKTYIACNTGTDINLPNPNINMYSVLTRFDEAAQRFTLLRTISSMPNGRFVTTSLHTHGSDVLVFGLGAYRASNVYLSTVPASSFESGQGTKYFAGLVNGSPVWSTSESAAVPLVNAAAGNVSVTYAGGLDLWLMTYDGFASPATGGVYFSYAAEPWGPWSAPQLIFNATRDGAAGKFIHDPRIQPNPPGDGLNGPTIGQNDPKTTPGAVYAPYTIERFTRLSGNKLSIYYTVSTWNPYTIVMMRSDFAVSRGAGRRRAARH